jgi:hypothetical protein
MIAALEAARSTSRLSKSAAASGSAAGSRLRGLQQLQPVAPARKAMVPPALAPSLAARPAAVRWLSRQRCKLKVDLSCPVGTRGSCAAARAHQLRYYRYIIP